MTETEETEREGRPPANLVALVAEFEAEQRDAEGLALLDWASVEGSRIGGLGPWTDVYVTIGSLDDPFAQHPHGSFGGDGVATGHLGPWQSETGRGAASMRRSDQVRQSVARRSLGR